MYICSYHRAQAVVIGLGGAASLMGFLENVLHSGEASEPMYGCPLIHIVDF